MAGKSKKKKSLRQIKRTRWLAALKRKKTMSERYVLGIPGLKGLKKTEEHKEKIAAKMRISSPLVKLRRKREHHKKIVDWIREARDHHSEERRTKISASVRETLRGKRERLTEGKFGALEGGGDNELDKDD